MVTLEAIERSRLTEADDELLSELKELRAIKNIAVFDIIRKASIESELLKRGYDIKKV
jgi:hypothetical protein